MLAGCLCTKASQWGQANPSTSKVLASRFAQRSLWHEALERSLWGVLEAIADSEGLGPGQEPPSRAPTRCRVPLEGC
jgi:hypothetical protein